MDERTIDGSLEAYVSAWKSYDRAQIEALLAPDVTYRYHPYDDPVRPRRGRGELAGRTGSPDGSSRDQPETYEASRAVAVDGSVAVATGSTRYRDQPGGPITRSSTTAS